MRRRRQRRPIAATLARRRRQHLALADVVGLADHAFGLHPLDDPGGAVVADLEMPLDKAGRGLALAADQCHPLVATSSAETNGPCPPGPRPRPARYIMSPRPSNSSAPPSPTIVRLSIFEV